VNGGKGAQRRNMEDRGLGTAQYDRGLRMRSLDLCSDAKSQRITAANSAEAKEIEITASEVSAGKAAKISFVSIRVSQPTVVDTIEVHDLRLEAFCLQHGGKTKDADRSKLAHDASCVPFAHGAVQLVGRGRTDEADFHGRERLNWGPYGAHTGGLLWPASRVP